MPLVTVSEVLRLALPPATEVSAGAAGWATPATWARLLRARPTSLGRIEHGEIWLLSAAALQLMGDRRSVARMVRDMGQAGVVAFVTPEPLGAGSRTPRPTRPARPILRVPTDTSLAEIEKAIVSVLVDRDRAIGQRVQEVYERLLATLRRRSRPGADLEHRRRSHRQSRVPAGRALPADGADRRRRARRRSAGRRPAAALGRAVGQCVRTADRRALGRPASRRPSRCGR